MLTGYSSDRIHFSEANVKLAMRNKNLSLVLFKGKKVKLTRPYITRVTRDSNLVTDKPLWPSVGTLPPPPPPRLSALRFTGI